MKSEYQGIRFENIENQKITSIKLPPETIKALGLDEKHKAPYDFIIEYIGKKKFDHIQKIFWETLEKTAGNKKKNCKFCGTKVSRQSIDKLCNAYHSEARINKFLGEWDFVNIVNKNFKYLQDKEQLKRLTIAFYECFSFKDWRVYFDLRKMHRACLKEGLITIAGLLHKAEYFERMKIISDSTHSLEMENLEHKMNTGESEELILLQIDFYKSKKKFYKSQRKIEKEGNKLNNTEASTYPFFSYEAKSIFKEFIKDNNKQTDLIYIYRKMYEDDLIKLEPSPFQEWLIKSHPELSTFKMKTLSEIGNLSKRNTIYNQLKKEFRVK